MKPDLTTPVITEFLQNRFDGQEYLAFDAMEISEKTGIALSTVGKWLTKKGPLNRITYKVVDGRRRYQFDPYAEIPDVPTTKGQRRNRVAKAAPTMRRKPGVEYAEIVWRDPHGPNMLLVDAEGRPMKAVYV